MLAGQRSLRGLRRWSRLGKRCTQARRPWPAGTALRPFPRPACVVWCQVCLWWCAHVLVTGAGATWAGGEVFWRVLAWDTLNQPASPPLRATAPHCAAHPALRTTSINSNNGVQGRGRGAGGGGWGCGQGAVRTSASAGGRPAMCRACITEGVVTPLSHPPPPQPLACAWLIFFFTPRLRHAWSPCCLPLSPFPSAFSPQPPSPSVSPSASLSFTWLWQKYKACATTSATMSCWQTGAVELHQVAARNCTRSCSPLNKSRVCSVRVHLNKVPCAPLLSNIVRIIHACRSWTQPRGRQPWQGTWWWCPDGHRCPAGAHLGACVRTRTCTLAQTCACVMTQVRTLLHAQACAPLWVPYCTSMCVHTHANAGVCVAWTADAT